MTTSLRFALLALFALLATACVAIPSRRSSPMAPNSSEHRGSCGFTVEVTSAPRHGWTIGAADASNSIQSTLVETGYFSTVRESPTEGVLPLRFQLGFIPSQAEYVVAAIGGSFGGLVPCWVTHEFALAVDAPSPAGDHRQFRYRGNCTVFVWLPLLPGALFLTADKAAREMVQDGVRDVIEQMRTEGMLPLTPERVAQYESVDESAREKIPDEPTATGGTGTGFFISPNGHIATSQHVIQGRNKILVHLGDRLVPARTLRSDAANDIAILELVGGESSPDFLAVACTTTPKIGDPVFTIGFPLVSLQGIDPKYTNGTISSMSGFASDPRQLQVSVPVQPGNSGGPLVDQRGAVVGVIQARLDDISTLESSGSLPQGVNYAIKSNYLCALMAGAVPVLDGATPSSEGESVIEVVSRAVVLIEAWPD